MADRAPISGERLQQVRSFVVAGADLGQHVFVERAADGTVNVAGEGERALYVTRHEAKVGKQVECAGPGSVCTARAGAAIAQAAQSPLLRLDSAGRVIPLATTGGGTNWAVAQLDYSSPAATAENHVVLVRLITPVQVAIPSA